MVDYRRCETVGKCGTETYLLVSVCERFGCLGASGCYDSGASELERGEAGKQREENEADGGKCES